MRSLRYQLHRPEDNTALACGDPTRVNVRLDVSRNQPPSLRGASQKSALTQDSHVRVLSIASWSSSSNAGRLAASPDDIASEM